MRQGAIDGEIERERDIEERERDSFRFIKTFAINK